MQSTNWAPEHCERAAGISRQGHVLFGDRARRSTRNSTPPIPAMPRSAAPGEWGLPAPIRPGTRPRPPPKAAPIAARTRCANATLPCPDGSLPVFERDETVKLRCVEIDPRHLSLLELEPGDCRYPYGGDEEGEAITFCGHPRREDSSYCAPHFHLTRGPGTAIGTGRRHGRTAAGGGGMKREPKPTLEQQP